MYSLYRIAWLLSVMSEISSFSTQNESFLGFLLSGPSAPKRSWDISSISLKFHTESEKHHFKASEKNYFSKVDFYDVISQMCENFFAKSWKIIFCRWVVISRKRYSNSFLACSKFLKIHVFQSLNLRRPYLSSPGFESFLTAGGMIFRW